MRSLLYLVLLAILSACVVAPRFDHLEGGQRVDQPGVSFVLPNGKPWFSIFRSTYQASFGRLDEPRKETFVVHVSVYNVPSPSPSKREFLKITKEGRANEPETGRFKEIRNNEELYEARSEICVIHKAVSKDYGAEAKRGGEYSVYDTFGMNCIHPDKPSVGILVELSRKAPPEITFPEFNTIGSALLESVKFGEF
jgi:hypothetical protein